MISSIRRFLLFNLLLSITITSSITAVGNYLLDNADIQHHLDTHLKQTTLFLNSILINNHKSLRKLKSLQLLINKNKKSEQPSSLTNNDQFQFQITNDKGNVLLRSNTADNIVMSKKNGFSDLQIGNDNWRTYSTYNKHLRLRITVAELYNFREELEQRITWNNLLIILCTYPLLGLLIWLTVGYGLKSLNKLAKRLAKRHDTDFSRVNIKNIPIEVQTLIDELNRLFLRLQRAFERNKHFASDAAHELRTPLAALKTQTQLALLATSDREREIVLKNLSLSIDRATHVVQQLLTLSRLGNKDTLDDIKLIDLTKVAAEILAQLAPTALEKDIDIELLDSHTEAFMHGNETALCILIRNLVDNAIRYTPEGGFVKVHVINQKNQIIFRVIDNGPGIQPKLRKQVFERFYRVLGSKVSGSGLGLAIVQQITILHHGRIELNTPPNGQGLQVDVIFPI